MTNINEGLFHQIDTGNQSMNMYEEKEVDEETFQLLNDNNYNNKQAEPTITIDEEEFQLLNDNNDNNEQTEVAIVVGEEESKQSNDNINQETETKVVEEESNNNNVNQSINNLETNAFKVLLLGDSHVGKKSFIEKLKTSDASDTEFKRIETESTVNAIRFKSIHCLVTFHIVYEMENNYDADGAILMFDVMNRSSYKNIIYYYRQIDQFCEKPIPIFLLGNKCDSNQRVVKRDHITFHTKKTRLQRHKISYCDVSVLSNFNLSEAFKWLASIQWGQNI